MGKTFVQRLLFALGVGPVTVAVTDIAAATLLHRDMWSGEQSIIAWRAAWISLPFLVLLVMKVRNRACWIAPAVATFAFFGYFTITEIARLLAGDKSGVNIGFGLLSIAFPIFALILSFVANLVTKATDRSTKHQRKRET